MYEIKVNVLVGVTPELSTILTELLDKKELTKSIMVEPEKASVEQQEPTEAPEQKPARRTRKEKAEEPKPEPVEAAPESEPEVPAENPVETTVAERELTEEDIRAAMHRTRERIEGDDYKDNPESDAYKKYHKQLTASFKRIAAELGSDKPSALPVDKRASFIAQVDQLVIENGLITTKLPF